MYFLQIKGRPYFGIISVFSVTNGLETSILEQSFALLLSSVLLSEVFLNTKNLRPRRKKGWLVELLMHYIICVTYSSKRQTKSFGFWVVKEQILHFSYWHHPMILQTIIICKVRNWTQKYEHSAQNCDIQQKTFCCTTFRESL